MQCCELVLRVGANVKVLYEDDFIAFGSVHGKILANQRQGCYQGLQVTGLQDITDVANGGSLKVFESYTFC